MYYKYNMVYFLSDAHLGSRAIADPEEHQQKLVNLLMRMGEDAEQIYLLGDIFDYWYEYVWESSRRSKRALFSPTLDAFKTLTSRGIAVHFFIGNHDIWTFGWLAQETGIIVHKKPEIVELYGQRIYMGHGDGIAPSDIMSRVPKDFKRRIRRFMLLRALFHSPIPQYLYRLMPTRWADEIGYEWARRSRMKELAHPCPYKGEDKEELVLFAKEAIMKGEKARTCNFYIFGHRHIELDLMIAQNCRVVILGDFFQNFTYASLSPTGQFTLENDE